MAKQIKRAARASSLTYPKTFRVRQIVTNGTKLYVRVDAGPLLCFAPTIPHGRKSLHRGASLGGERSFGSTMATVMRFAASKVEEGVVPDSGH
jgi:hypothetical protein